MNWKRNVIFILLVTICCIPIFLVFNKGINYFDEGYILEGARRILSGEIPYRDFHFIYTPGIIYLLAFFLRIGGQYIIVERLAAALLSVIGVIFLGLLTLKLTKNNILTFLSMLLYSLWGPVHINFFWPVMTIIPFLFIYLFLLSESHLFLSGVVLGIILLFKQNFGAALVISFLCYLVFVRYSKRQIFMIFLGFLSVMTLFTVNLLATQSFIPFISEMNAYTIQQIIIRKSFSVPFPTQSIGKFVLYTFPGIASFVISIGLTIKKKDKTLFFIPFTIFLFYLFGIFPTPDWTHLTPLISVTGILFALLPLIFGSKYRFLSYFLMTFVIGAGIYGTIVRNYYRWEAPFINQTYCFSSKRMKFMCIDSKNKAVITQTLASIEKEAKNNDFIFAFYNNPIYYFLTQKNNPTHFIDFNGFIGVKEEEKVINELRKKKVEIIMTRFSPQNSQSEIISNYIEKNYSPINTIYEFSVWKYKTHN